MAAAATAVTLLTLSGPATAGTAHANPGGTWGNAEAVPGIAALAGTTGSADTSAMSCLSPGNCGAGGYYTAPDSAPGQFNREPFVVNQTNGTWGTAHEVPGTPFPRQLHRRR